MNRLRCWAPLLGIGLLLLSGVRADAQERPDPGRPPTFRDPAEVPRPVVTAEMADKLKLTPQQKEKIDKLQAAFDDKQKAAYARAREAMEKAQKDGDPEGFRKAREQYADTRKSLAKQRIDLEVDIKEVLDEAQQKQFDELKRLRRPGGTPPPFEGVVGQPPARQPPAGQPPFGGPPGFGGPATVGPLLTPDMREKLKLTDQQKEKVDKLVKEFDDRQRQAGTKFRDIAEKARQGGDPEGFRKAAEQFREMQQSLVKERGEAEAKLKDLLDDEQKTRFEELKKSQAPYGPQPFGTPPFGGPGAPPSPGGAPFGQMMRPFPGQVLPAPLQDRLRLTPEQKAKLEKIQKEAEEKVLGVLTEEQKKQLDEIRRRMDSFSPPPPERPRGRPEG